MRKSSIFSGLVLLLILGCFGLALADEVFTITTYYPSPYGSYNELQSNKLAIGDTNVDPFSPGFDPTDMPPENGSLWVARSVILKPQSIPLSNPTTGELAYDASTDKLSLYNGSAWVTQAAGGGGVVFSLKCKWMEACGATGCHGSNVCTSPTCPSSWTDLGTGCVRTGIAYDDGNSDRTYVGYCERWCYKL